MINRRCEKLKIVFFNDAKADKEKSTIGAITLEKFISSADVDPSDVFRKIITHLRLLGKNTEFKENGIGKSISADFYLARIKKQKKWTRPIETDELIFRFGDVPSYQHSFVSIEEKNVGSAGDWIEWTKLFFSEENFVQAWLSDVEYDYWQNVTDPLQYESQGKSYIGLAIKSNGLPPPLDNFEIDTSSNPGRWSLRSGYVEAIGSLMWLGSRFWKNIGEVRRNAILSKPWLNIEHLDSDVIQISAAESCFFDSTSEDVQKKLRTILYG